MITFALAACLIILFGAVAFRGAPYVPTHKVTIIAALEMLKPYVKKGGTILDLGSGDGSVLLHAAKNGYKAVGYELNPILSFIAWLRCWRRHLHINIHLHDFWIATWPKDTKAVFVFLAGPYMKKLGRKLDAEMAKRTEPLYVVSNGFAIPGVLPKKISAGLYLYELKPGKR
jgi:tRNA1(Val) A37 N6-methylase TrmN6